MKEIANFIINTNFTIKNAIKKLDEGGIGIICVNDLNDKLVGIITDGDFRRAILAGIPLDENVLKIINKNFTSVNENYTSEQINQLFDEKPIQQIPVIKDGHIVEIILKKGILETEVFIQLKIPTVIMAGGKGTRLAPFTNILPKPLIPIGEKPIIEVIMNEYKKYGINDFYISVNYKSKLIKAYFEDEQNNFNIKYIDEDKPLGTAGALKYLEGKINGSFFVSNCDIIIKDNYATIFDFHQKNEFDLTLVASMQHVTIPYGVCNVKPSGELINIKEKPEYDYLVNTGMYILKSTSLAFIPENSFFNITDLILELQRNGKKIGVFPVSEKSWIDIGQWDEYKKTIQNFI